MLQKLKKKSLNVLTVVMGIICCLCVTASADTLETNDGRLIEGKYRGGTEEYIWFQVGDELKGFAIKDTVSIHMGPMGKSPGIAEDVKIKHESGASPVYAPPTATYTPLPPKPETITVPAGTRLIVRMDSGLDSRKHGVGHKFSVTLENNIVVDNKTMSSKGSKLYGRLSRAKKSGRLFGASKLDLELTDAMINGVPHPIITSGVQAVGDSTTKNTLGTTAVGAGIGAIADGSDGALTGAAIGLGISLLRGGSDIHIASGTILEFRLMSELTFVP